MFVHYVIAISSTPTWCTAEQKGRTGPDRAAMQWAVLHARQQVVTMTITESRSRCGPAGRFICMIRCDPCRDLLDATAQN